MEDYLKLLLEQVRCQKAHPMIEQEMRGHLEDQVAANRFEGMGDEDALKAALLDMGDPVEVGVELDRVHRPQMAWDMIVMMALVSVVSFLIHIVIGKGQENIAGYLQNQYIAKTAAHIVIGFVMMLLVYRIDYSIFARCGKFLAIVFLVGMTLLIVYFGISLNGAKSWVRVGGLSINIAYLMLLYVPLYGTVLYEYRGNGWRGIVMSLVFLLYPLYLTREIPNISVTALLLGTMAGMLLLAVWKGWFCVSKKIATVIVLALPVLPVAILCVCLKLDMLPAYQRERLLSIFRRDYAQYDYVSRVILESSKSNHLIGSGSTELAGYLPDYYSDFILSFISGCFGMVAAVSVCSLLGVVLLRAFRISLLQRNQLGMMLGCGCGMVLAISVAFNIVQNFSLLPRTQTFLPFFSFGGTQIVVSYILIGIVLSVYRYKNIQSDQTAPKIHLFRNFLKRRGVQG